MLQTMVMVVGPGKKKKKKKAIKADRCNPAKDPPMVKSIFSLGQKDGKL